MQGQKIIGIVFALLSIVFSSTVSLGNGSSEQTKEPPAVIDSAAPRPPKAKNDCACPSSLTGTPTSFLAPVNIANNLPAELTVQLYAKRDWLPLLLPFVTLITVISGAMITLRQIRIRSEETQNGFRESLESQRAISSGEQETQRQISRSETLSKLRQAWIDSLRSELAEFVTLCEEVNGRYRAAMSSGSPWPGNSWSLVHSVEKSRTLIRLRLNPDETEHNKLVKAMEDIQNASSTEPLSTRYNTLVTQAQSILKSEWNRVKKGE